MMSRAKAFQVAFYYHLSFLNKLLLVVVVLEEEVSRVVPPGLLDLELSLLVVVVSVFLIE
jgi:hypothetical protein